MRAIDFFCGAGGFTVGLRQAGIDVIAGIDSNEACGKTYSANNTESRFICADIRQIDGRALLEVLPGLRIEDDELVFVGCAPCQPFSQQRRSAKPHRDASLLSCFGSLVIEFRPAYVVVENVPGIATVRGNSTFNRFVLGLRRAGYSVEKDVLDAKEFGVPQSRRRLVLIASRRGQAALPVPTHGPGRRPWRTVRQAIAEYPRLPAGGSADRPANHRASALSDLNLKRMQCTPHDGGSRADWPDELVLACHKDDYRGHSDVYGRLHWDEPAPTLTGRCHSISNGRYGHPEQDRALTLREAAALQTFPDDYVFEGSLRSIALQIGNAVPVRLARTLGQQVVGIAHMDDNSEAQE